MTSLGRIVFGFFSLATIVLVSFFIKVMNSSGNQEVIVYEPSPEVVVSPTPLIIKSGSLSDVVNKSLEGTKGKYSIYIKNLKTGETFAKDENLVYQAGSLYKLWLLGPVFQLINSGNIKLSDVLSGNVGKLNREFGVDSEFTELPETDNITLTVNDAVTQMITISHNYAAMMLLDKVGREKVNNYIKSLGLNNSGLKDLPYTTAFDTALFFEKLYKGEVLNRESSLKMIDILVQQTFNDGIPRNLPKGLSIAHKTGDIDMFKHDCGIVFSPKSDYIICILSESDLPIGAQERIALISSAVYNYFQKLKN